MKIWLWISLLLAPTLGIGQEDTAKRDSLEQVLGQVSGLEAAYTLKSLITETWQTDREASFGYINQLEGVAGQAENDSISAFLSYYQALQVYLEGGYAEAAVGFATAAELHLKSGNPSDALQATAREGVMYSLLGQNEKAGGIYKAALQKAKAFDEPEAEAYLLSQLATVYHYKGVADSAKHYYLNAIEKYDALQDSSGMLRNMNNLLILQQKTQDLNGTLQVLQSIYDFYMRNSQYDNASHTLCAKGDALYDMNQNNEAFNAYLEAYEMAQKNGHSRSMSNALSGMASIEVDRENPLKARSYLNEALDYYQDKAKEADGTAALQTELGYTYLLTEQYDSAAYYYNSALAIADSLQFERFRNRALVGLGEARLQQGQIAEAKAIAKQLSALSEAFADPEVLYSYYALEGALRLDLKDYSGAIPFLSDTYHYNLEVGRPELALEKASYLLEAHKGLGQAAQALEYAEAINRLKDTLDKSQDLERLAEQRSAFEFQLEKQKIEAEQAKQEAVLRAESAQSRNLALGSILLAMLGFSFFWYARRQNKTIALQNKQLQQLNETKDRLFAIIGHDLRKPAIAFRGIAKKVNYLLRKKDFATLEQLGEEIEQDAAGLSQLTENLLNWALTQRNVMPYQPAKLKLLPLLEETVKPFQTVLQNKQLTLTWEVPEQASVYSDANALSTIVRNLLDNAIKFTPMGGSILLKATPENDMVKLDVRDSGIGIPKDKLQDLFLLKEGETQPGTAGEKGAGLGLHLAFELSKLNKSRLNVNSQPGKGTIFTLGLPMQAQLN